MAETLLEMLAQFANLPTETEESPQLRARLLHQIGDIEELLHAAELESRLLAACALARLAPAQCLLSVIIEGLQSHDEAHRVFAAFACRCLGPRASSSGPALIEVLETDDDEIVVNHVLRAMASIGVSAKATPRLVELIRRAGPNALMVTNADAINAAMALGTVPDAREAPTILYDCLAFCDSGDDLLRTLALESARAIWRIGGEVEAPLRVAKKLLDDEDGTIKAHAADLLGELGVAARPALANLQRLLGDESEYVRKHAREAMARIGTLRSEEEK